MAQYIDFSLLIKNPHMGNTQAMVMWPFFRTKPAIKNQHQSLIFSPSWLSQSSLSLILISELILAHWPLLPSLRWVLILLLLLLFLNSFNSSVLFICIFIYILSRRGSVPMTQTRKPYLYKYIHSIAYPRWTLEGLHFIGWPLEFISSL
jgi:hypothetical protein